MIASCGIKLKFYTFYADIGSSSDGQCLKQWGIGHCIVALPPIRYCGHWGNPQLISGSFLVQKKSVARNDYIVWYNCVMFSVQGQADQSSCQEPDANIQSEFLFYFQHRQQNQLVAPHVFFERCIDDLAKNSRKGWPLLHVFGCPVLIKQLNYFCTTDNISLSTQYYCDAERS